MAFFTRKMGFSGSSYVFPDSASNKPIYDSVLPQVSMTPLDLIAVILPEGANGLEIRGSGVTESPTRILPASPTPNARVKMFPATQSSAGGVGALTMFFSVPATPMQQLIGEYFLKAFLYFLHPL